MRPATGKQISFIESICEALDLKKPQNMTMQEASSFISENVGAFYRHKTISKIKANEKINSPFHNIDDKTISTNAGKFINPSKWEHKHITVEKSLENIKRDISKLKVIRRKFVDAKN